MRSNQRFGREGLNRIAAIVRADFFIRFRRWSTLVVFLLISAVAYLWIPDPATGRALIQIDGRRAVYNSSAIGMGTASLASILIGLFGFYVISNAIGRDVSTRCGSIIASTGVRSHEYLFGKFLGNLAFLVVFTSGFMFASMGMLLVRGEAPLEPLVFIGQYLLLVPPALVFVSVIAVLFESIKFLSGRFGDVVYFFLWMGTLGGVAAATEMNGPGWTRYFDHSGFAFMMEQLRFELGADSISIGASPFDPSKPTFIFPGLQFGTKWIAPRLGSLLSPLPLLLLAQLFFHRFDPTRVRAGGTKERKGWLAKINLLATPLTRLLAASGIASIGGRGVLGQAWRDAMLTVTLNPLSLVGAIGFAIAAFSATEQSLFSGVLPIAFAGLAVLLSDIASRDHRRGTASLLYSMPGVRERFPLFKLASMMMTSLFLLLLPIVRGIILRPSSAPALLAGVLLVVTAANFLSIATRNPKTFIVLFLSFWYIVMNDKGATAAMNFAGFFATPPASVTLAYAVAGVMIAIATSLFHARRLTREY